jgi:hypothetical protein
LVVSVLGATPAALGRCANGATHSPGSKTSSCASASANGFSASRPSRDIELPAWSVGIQSLTLLLYPLTGFTRPVFSNLRPLMGKSLMQLGFSSKVALMRYRIKVARSKGDQERQREHRRTLALITTIACVPFLAVILIAVLSTEPDLSDLLPSNKQASEYIVLSWSEVLQPRSQLNSAVMKLDGSTVRALGYMMDGDNVTRPSDLVQHFVLPP